MHKLFIKYLVVLSITYLIFGDALFGGTSVKNVVASRVTNPPKIDGILTEDVWQSAVAVSGFQQFDPDEGASVTEVTSVRILFDDGALYVGVICYDSNPEKIVKQLTRRDRSVQADRFSVIIDSYHDHSTAFLFGGSVSGVQSDGILSQDGLVYDVQWDAVWDFDARILSDGWSAEFKIPYSALRFSDQEGENVWGINFRRYIARKKETDEWVMVPRAETPPGTISSVSKMGNLSGISNIHPPQHIEMLPYHVSKMDFLSQPLSLPVHREYKPNVGIDIKYGITNNFTLDLAVNPDFGQVEVDKKILNLSVFETEYPEKRPFFLEGSQIFSFGNSFDSKQLQLLYSRRIGRYPSRNDTLDRNGYDGLYPGWNAVYSKKPEVTTILGAGKLTGRTNDGLEVGVLTAVTDRENAVIKSQDGYYTPPIMVEPRANYNVLRLRKHFSNGSLFALFGLMATSSFKQQCYPAYSGGVDWQMRILNGAYGTDGYLAGSRTQSYSGQQITAGSGGITIGKLEDEHWIAFSGYDFSSKNFFIDDLGFYSQPREHGGYTALSYKEDRAASPFIRYGLTTQTDYRWNWDGAKTLNTLELEPFGVFRNFWSLSLDYIHDFPAHDDENKLSDGEVKPAVALYRRPVGNMLAASIRTDPRQVFEVFLNAVFSNNTKQAQTLSFTVETTVRPNSWMEFVPAFTIMRTSKEESWVKEKYRYSGDGHNIFADRDVNYHDLSFRGTITFAKNMSFQFFTQVMLAKWRYVNFKSLISPSVLSSVDTLLPIDLFFKVFNANIVFRWEYLPGSTFYLVWTQGRKYYGYDGAYQQNIRRDFNDVMRLPMDNVILAKVTYWGSL